MSEVLFYHLEKRSLDEALPGLLERTVARGWRAQLRAESAERAAAIDALLWTYDDESFLPHAMADNRDTTRQPVLITVEPDNSNGATVLFVVGGAQVWNWAEAGNTFERIVVLVDGRDPGAMSIAREGWKAARDAGLEVTYWRQTTAGKWEKQN